MNLRRVLIACVLLVSASAIAQMPTKPGAELKKADIFSGTWTTEATIAQGPWGMGGKFTSTSVNEWQMGDFFLVGRADYKMPPEVGGEGKTVSYIGYDTTENMYTMDEYNSAGVRGLWKGSVSGDTWTFTSSQSYAGQDIKQKMTIKVLSPTSQSVKFEVSMDGTNWLPFMEGKATKK